MNKITCIASFLIAALLFAGNILAREFKLKNNSKKDTIYLRNISNADSQKGATMTWEAHLIKPQESIALDSDQKYSMTTQGVDNYYDVPIKQLLEQSARNDPTKHMQLTNINVPVVVASPGYLIGWSFALDWQRK